MTNGARAQIQIDEINKDIRKICKWIKGIEVDIRKLNFKVESLRINND